MRWRERVKSGKREKKVQKKKKKKRGTEWGKKKRGTISKKDGVEGLRCENG